MVKLIKSIPSGKISLKIILPAVVLFKELCILHLILACKSIKPSS